MTFRNVDKMSAWSALLCLLIGGFTIASAAEYEVDGQIEQKIYNMDGSVGADEKGQFTVFVKACAWLIETTELDKSGKTEGIRQTACVNGTEVYEVWSPFRNASAGANRSSFWNDGLIVSNNIPVGQNDGDYVGHLWLMFASGCYLSNQSTSYLTPVYDVNASTPENPAL